MPADNKGIVARVGPLTVDVPRTAGFYGGIGLAMAVGIVEWPVALFIGAIPVIKILGKADMPDPVRFVVHMFDGAAKPVGGDAEGTIQLNHTPAGVRRAAQMITPGVRVTTQPRKSRPRRRPAATRRRPAATTGSST